MCCGKETSVGQTLLQNGRTKSCGCLARPPVKDLIGMRFGKLVALSYEGDIDGQYYWRCRCDCGNEAVIRQNNLVLGRTKSCGCIQREIIRENMKWVDGTSVKMLESIKDRPIGSNTSGYTGVYQNKRTGRWVAQITFKQKTYYLGSFEKIEDAIKARQRGEEMHDNFLEWYYREYLPKENQGNTTGPLQIKSRPW